MTIKLKNKVRHVHANFGDVDRASRSKERERKENFSFFFNSVLNVSRQVVAVLFTANTQTHVFETSNICFPWRFFPLYSSGKLGNLGFLGFL